MNEIIQELLTALKIKDEDWDAIVIGDGSGSRWGYPGGWATILFDKDTKFYKVLYGAVSDTTVNVCELVPYIFTMHWYSRAIGKTLQHKIMKESDYISPRPVNIHIVTDCDIIAEQGNRRANREVNMPYWKALDDFERQNYNLVFHWIPRDTYEANKRCDVLSKRMRLFIKEEVEAKLLLFPEFANPEQLVDQSVQLN